MSDHELLHPFKGPGAAANGLDRHQEYAGEVCPHFQLGLNRLGFLKCPIDTDLKGLRSGECHGCTMKTVHGHILIQTFFLV
jgi:hypothetical protein